MLVNEPTGYCPNIKNNTVSYNYTHDYAVLYSLAVGYNPTDLEHIKYVYDESEDFEVPPTFGSVVSMHAFLESPVLKEQLQRINADPTKMVHAEHYTEIFEPLPPACTLTSISKVTAILDKGIGALAIIDVDSYNEEGVKMMNNQLSVFFHGAGNYNGPRFNNKTKDIVQIPHREADAVVLETVTNNEDALFHLCGEETTVYNDSSFAIGGPANPILNGLGVYGHTARHVLSQFGYDGVSVFKAMKARFSGSIRPGSTLKTEMWKEGTRIIFQCMDAESGKPLVTGGYVDMEVVLPLFAAKSLFTPGTSIYDTTEKEKSGGGGGGDGSSGSEELISDLIFAEMSNQIKENPKMASRIRAIYQWNITKNGRPAAEWIVDLKNGTGEVYRGPIKSGEANCALTLDDEDFFNLVIGKLEPTKAYLTGRLKVKGNIMLTQKLQAWLASNRAPSPNDRTPKLPSEKSIESAPIQTDPSKEPPMCLKSDIIFECFSERLLEVPDITDLMNVVYHWIILRDGKKMSDWTVDLKTGKGSIYKSTPKVKADCVITTDDEDTMKMLLGKLNPHRAFMQGRLRVRGNVLLAQRLDQLWQETRNSGIAVEIPLLEPVLGDKPLDKRLYSEYAFLVLIKKLSKNPDLSDKVNTIFEWTITKDGKNETTWTLDLKKPLGGVHRGPSQTEKATCFISIDDQDFADMVMCKLPAEKVLKAGGRALISGDVTAAEKIIELFKVTPSKL